MQNLIVVVITTEQKLQLDRYLLQFRIENPRWVCKGRNYTVRLIASTVHHISWLDVDIFDRQQAGEDGGNIYIELRRVLTTTEQLEFQNLSYSVYPQLKTALQWGWPSVNRISLLRAKYKDGSFVRKVAYSETDEEQFRQSVWILAQWILRLNTWMQSDATTEQT